MKRIGIDFGTTNTTLSYYDEKNDHFCKYRFSSAIAYHKTENRYFIGPDAQERRDNSNFYFYEYYKISLVESWNKIANKEHGKTYFELMKDYLHKLIVSYKYKSLSKESKDGLLDVIVVSVPNVLLSNDKIAFKNELEKFLKTEARIGFLVSEPACSAAYYSKQVQKDFSGDLIVLDCGGGSLDVSICQVNKELNKGNILPAISVIQQHSMNSGEISGNGAGIAFCNGVIKVLSVGTANPGSFSAVYEFDKTFSDLPEKDTESIEYFYSNNKDEEMDSEISFRLNEEKRTIRYSTIDQIFQEVTKPTLSEMLNEVLKDRSDAKLISVGGFSNFPGVNETIAEKLGTGFNQLGLDSRIVQLTKDDKCLSVSYGAALYASNEVIRSSKTSFEISLLTFDGKDEHRVVLIEEGASIEDYNQYRWLKQQFEIIDSNAVIKLLISSKKSISPLAFQVDISNADLSKKTVLIGATISDRGTFICIHNNQAKTRKEYPIDEYISEFENKRL